MTSKLTDAQIDNLIQLYKAGTSANKLSHEFSVSRTLINRILRLHDIEPRSQSDAERTKWSFMDSSKRQAQVAAAHITRRGQKDSTETKLARARTRYQRLLHVGRYELEIANMVGGETQFPLGAYNLDVAISESRIAVEIITSHLTDAISLRKERIEYIFNAGWSLLVIEIPDRAKDKMLVHTADNILTFAEKVRSNPTTRRQYGVIRCDGKPVPTSRFDIDDGARVGGF